MGTRGKPGPDPVLCGWLMEETLQVVCSGAVSRGYSGWAGQLLFLGGHTAKGAWGGGRQGMWLQCGCPTTQRRKVVKAGPD